jgi:uncharacterized protein (TIGR03000 family)
MRLHRLATGAVALLAGGMLLLVPLGVQAGHGGGGHGGGGHGGGGHGGGGHGGYHGGGYHGGGYHGGSGYYHGGSGYYHNNYPYHRYGYYPGFYGLGFGWPFYSGFGYGGGGYGYSNGGSGGYQSFYNGSTDQSAQPPYPFEPADDGTIIIAVRVPPGASLWFGDTLTTQTGHVRYFHSPKLTPGDRYTYELTASWPGADGQDVVRKQTLSFQAGERPWYAVDFLGPNPPESGVLPQK